MPEHNHEWETWEEEMMRSRYGKCPVEAIMTATGRTRMAIQRKASDMGIADAARRRRGWTGDEEAQIITLYHAGMGCVEMGDRLKRPASSCSSKLKELRYAGRLELEEEKPLRWAPPVEAPAAADGSAPVVEALNLIYLKLDELVGELRQQRTSLPPLPTNGKLLVG